MHTVCALKGAARGYQGGIAYAAVEMLASKIQQGRMRSKAWQLQTLYGIAYAIAAALCATLLTQPLHIVQDVGERTRVGSKHIRPSIVLRWHGRLQRSTLQKPRIRPLLLKNGLGSDVPSPQR